MVKVCAGWALVVPPPRRTGLPLLVEVFPPQPTAVKVKQRQPCEACPATAAWERKQKHAGQGGAASGGVPGSLARGIVLERSDCRLGQPCGGLGGLEDE
jgi:hypothetical protein